MFSFGVGPSTGAATASPQGANVGLGSVTNTTSPKDEFLEYAKMTPAEKIRASILGGMGLTEDDLAAMDDKDRLLLEDRIKELIKEKVVGEDAGRTGAIVDLKA